MTRGGGLAWQLSDQGCRALVPCVVLPGDSPAAARPRYQDHGEPHPRRASAQPNPSRALALALATTPLPADRLAQLVWSSSCSPLARITAGGCRRVQGPTCAAHRVAGRRGHDSARPQDGRGMRMWRCICTRLCGRRAGGSAARRGRRRRRGGRAKTRILGRGRRARRRRGRLQKRAPATRGPGGGQARRAGGCRGRCGARLARRGELAKACTARTDCVSLGWGLWRLLRFAGAWGAQLGVRQIRSQGWGVWGRQQGGDGARVGGQLACNRVGSWPREPAWLCVQEGTG